MIIGLGGYVEGASENPFLTLTPGPLDVPVIRGPVSQDRREDLQTWGALNALGMNGIGVHPLDATYGNDPPDRWLISGDRSWGAELTELTVQDLRGELARIRAFGRRLHERVLADSARFSHLRGRLVLLSLDPRASLPKKTDSLLDDLEQVLSVDKGYVGEGQDVSAGPPQKLGESGFYGDHGPFHVVANRNPNSDQILISASTQAQVFQSDALNALGDRVAAKDEVGNDTLIITCGLPDYRGYTCPADQAMFQLLLDATQADHDVLPEKPTYIRGVLIHLWNSPHVIVWGNGDLPWIVPES